jgi:hypothetical protein
LQPGVAPARPAKLSAHSVREVRGRCHLSLQERRRGAGAMRSNSSCASPQRGPLQQFRFAESTAFRCFRCGDTKKSKLISVYGGDWSRRLCNGCYGRLLSLYEIKTGAAADDEKVEKLTAALFSAVRADDQRQAERLFRASKKKGGASFTRSRALHRHSGARGGPASSRSSAGVVTGGHWPLQGSRNRGGLADLATAGQPSIARGPEYR